MIELEVAGQPSSCRAAADDLEAVAAALDDAMSDMRSVHSSSQAAWEGRAADSFRRSISGVEGDAEKVGTSLRTCASALSDFAASLAAVEAELAHARSVALAGGNRVTSTQILRPDDMAGPAAPEMVEAHNRQVAAYDEAFSFAQAARTSEREAHSRLIAALARATGAGMLRFVAEGLGLLPSGPGGVDRASWGAGVGLTGAGLGVNWVRTVALGNFAPRANGSYISYVDSSRWRNAYLRGFDSNWQAKPGKSVVRNRWGTAGKVVGRAGTAISFGTAAFEQWSADADDPTMSTTEKATRSGVMSITTGGGAWAGAVGGAQLGATIGSFGGPVGTVVGGAVGGLVGGFVGSELGSAVGDALKDPVGDIADAVGDAVGDAAEAIGDAASDLGDKLSFWD